jgi:hypothetical protein
MLQLPGVVCQDLIDNPNRCILRHPDIFRVVIGRLVSLMYDLV